MPVDWKSAESYNRLLAATLASLDGNAKLNYKRIADFFGQGATYDAIEGRFRIIKKQAGLLQEEVNSGRETAPPRGTLSAGSTPRKPRTPKNSGILNGRVAKASGGSPTKKRSAAQVKAEAFESSTSSSATGDEAPTPATSTNTSGVHETSFTLDIDQLSQHMSFEMPTTQNGHENLGFLSNYDWLDMDEA